MRLNDDQHVWFQSALETILHYAALGLPIAQRAEAAIAVAYALQLLRALGRGCSHSEAQRRMKAVAAGDVCDEIEWISPADGGDLLATGPAAQVKLRAIIALALACHQERLWRISVETGADELDGDCARYLISIESTLQALRSWLSFTSPI